jgi:integrase
MARTVRDATLQTREARRRLKPAGKPYYRTIEEGLHLGYRKPREGAGKWVARHYVGKQSYQVETLAPADDLSDADGDKILDFKQAQERARTLMVGRARTAAGKPSGPMTVRVVIEDYLRFLEEHRKTAKDARWRADALILPTLGDIEIEALTTDQIQKWLSDTAKRPARVRSPVGKAGEQHRKTVDDEAVRRRRATTNRTFTILKAALNRSWRQGKIKSDSAWRRVEPFEDVERARVRYLTIEEATRLINASDPEFRPLVQAALLTGARYGELGRLTVTDFNPDAGTIAIRLSKSGKSRHVYLSDEGVNLFKRLSAGRRGRDLLLSRNDGTAWGVSDQGRPMELTCGRAKVDPPINFHGLRHTYASLAVMNGAPLLVIAKNLGHADTRMVEKHYGHLAPSYVADAIRAAAPRFGIPHDGKVERLGGRAAASRNNS